jgi:hypothetical protein
MNCDCPDPSQPIERKFMNKLLIGFTICAFGLAVSSTAIAADPAYPEKNTSPQSTQPDAKAAPNNNPAGAAADKKNNSEPISDAYSAELKKCDDLRGGEKQSCVDKVQGKYGKM